MRVINWVHGHTTNRRAHATPAFRASLTEGASCAHCYPLPLRLLGIRLTRAAFHLSACATSRNCLREPPTDEAAGASDHLRALAGLEFHAVNHTTHGDISNGQRVTGLNRSRRSAHDRITCMQTLRSDDVTALAICILQQRDISGAIWSYSRRSTTDGIPSLLRSSR